MKELSFCNSQDSQESSDADVFEAYLKQEVSATAEETGNYLEISEAKTVPEIALGALTSVNQESREINGNKRKKSTTNGNKWKNKKESNDFADTTGSSGVIYRPIDAYQAFGDFVAAELRSLRSGKHRKQLKRTIQREILKISELDDSDNSFDGNSERNVFANINVNY